MDKMFDTNHDGKLSDRERMDRDYFINEMKKDSANPKPTLPSYRHNQYNYIAAKWVGLLLIAIGINTITLFPVFGVIMLVLGLIVMIG